MTLRDQLLPIKQKMAREQTTVITVPRKFALKIMIFLILIITYHFQLELSR